MDRPNSPEIQISDQLIELASYWESLGPKRWFQSTAENDTELTERYGDLYDYVRNPDNGVTPGTVCSKREWLGYVILFDQIRRHVNRLRCTSDGLPAIEFIQECKTKFEFLNASFDGLTDYEFMFILFPVRHTHHLADMTYVADKTWTRLEAQSSQAELSPLLRNYLVATYERYNKLAYDITENIRVYEPNSGPELPRDSTSALITSLDEFSGLLDPNCGFSGTPRFQICPDMHRQQHINDETSLVNVVRVYLAKHPVKDEKCPWNIPLVSLSGGVDSMLCSYLLYVCGVEFACVHINYMNRAECLEEEQFLRYWCAEVIRVPLYVRQIREINRPRCMANGFRDLYESYTHNVRFDTYVNVGEYIILGHNQDDTVENTLTNLAACSHYDNLLGMREFMAQTHRDEPLKLLRPLLQVSKAEIYQFAKQYSIPYLADSTPKWSQRGKIRDIVRPAIQSWNPQLITGLTTLSGHLSEMTSLLTILIGNGREIYTSIDDLPTNQMYWQILFRNRQLQVTQRTLAELVGKIEYLKSRPEKLVINQPMKFTLCKNTMLKFMRIKTGEIVLTIDSSSGAN
jgi:tRNA(Ile)-lysidine synthase TilS/MesJ